MIKLIHGDCLEEMTKLSSDSIDAIITDPPYGIQYLSNKQLGNTRQGKMIATREKHYFDYLSGDNDLPVQWLTDAYRVLKDNSAIYIFCRWDKFGALQLAAENAGFKIKNMIVMNKSNHGMGDLKGAYASKHELVLYATKGRHILNCINGRMKDVIDCKVLYSGAKRHHPTEKPTSWILPFVQESTKINNIVLDPFMGSGTTGVVCKQNGRDFIGIEKDRSYFEIAQNRINSQ